jgi:hypothetical protein
VSTNRPKQFEVLKRTTRPMKGVTVGGRTLNFGNRTDAFLLNDVGIARELQKNHKHDVVVCEVDKPHTDVSSNFHTIKRALDPNWKPWYERREALTDGKESE